MTTAPRRIHVEATVDDITVMLPDELLSEYQEIEATFRQVFRAVSAFNALGKHERIRTLGIHLELINAPQGDARQEAEAIKAAYLLNRA